MTIDIFDYASSHGFGDLHFKIDEKTGLRAIVAIHSTVLGPALGGCRCIPYDTTEAALMDAMRLAKAMSYKAAIAGLPHGGGKAVLIKPQTIADRQAYFTAFGNFVAELGGRYITAVDSGTSTEDMDIIGRQTDFVTSDSRLNGDTSLFTARGVIRSLEACVKFQTGKDSVKGMSVALQGVGNVGYYMARILHEAGATLYVTDTNQAAVDRCVKEFKAQAVALNEIASVPCDIFAPCALGGAINDNTLPQLRAKIVVGCANNQLRDPQHGQILFQKDILYSPDFVANAGGLVYAAGKYDGLTDAEIDQKVDDIFDVTLAILQRAKAENISTDLVAISMAKEKLTVK